MTTTTPRLTKAPVDLLVILATTSLDALGGAGQACSPQSPSPHSPYVWLSTTWKWEHTLLYSFRVFLTLFEAILLYVSSVAQLPTPVCYHSCWMWRTLLPRNSRETGSKSSSKTRDVSNRGIVRSSLCSWRHLCHIRHLDLTTGDSESPASVSTRHAQWCAHQTAELASHAPQPSRFSLCCSDLQSTTLPLFARNARPMHEEMLQQLLGKTQELHHSPQLWVGQSCKAPFFTYPDNEQVKVKNFSWKMKQLGSAFF